MKIGKRTLFIIVLIGILIIALYFLLPKLFTRSVSFDVVKAVVEEEVVISEPKAVVTHIEPPMSIRGIYMTSWVAGTSNMRNKVIKVADETEINAIVIDIKDDTGKISYQTSDPYLVEIGSSENRILEIASLIQLLHQKEIYVIGRISVFQDPYLVERWPEEAVKQSDTKTLWKDRKGLSWFDAGSKKVWDYVVAIAKDAYSVGFDEINFDYIRFPSDGNMQDIYFPISEGKEKPAVMEEFFIYLNQELGTIMPISADIFGMTTSNTDDLNIGQVLEKTIPYFDYVSPMVYPSHYPKTWNGYANPASVPYEVIFKAMTDGYKRVVAMGENPQKLRPWLQDFNLGATYTKEMVREQITATYDVGLSSWILWDPSNTYTVDALQKEGNDIE